MTAAIPRGAIFLIECLAGYYLARVRRAPGVRSRLVALGYLPKGEWLQAGPGVARNACTKRYSWMSGCHAAGVFVHPTRLSLENDFLFLSALYARKVYEQEKSR